MLWGPPRSLSTTVERALVEHKDIQVHHEPFGTPHYWSGEAASSRNADEARTSDTFASVAKKLWHSPLNPGKVHLFSKNLSYYFAPHCIPSMYAFLGGDYSKIIHSFIIRHPAKAIASLYYKSCIDNEKTGYTHFDPAEAGYTAMWDLLKHLEQQPGCPPLVIIDADDLLEDPEGLMSAYCDAVGLPFHTGMLSWTPGPCKELESPWSGWTDDVINSSGITKRAKRSSPPQTDALPNDVRETIAEAMPIYEHMFARRLRPAHAPATEPLSASSSETASSGKIGGVSVIGCILLALSVAIWVTQAEILADIATDEWNKPYTQAILLKSVWAITLPIWYALHTCQKAMQEEITFRRPLKPTLKVVLLGVLMMVLTQSASATWIASLSLTAVSINTAIYNVNPLLVYVFSIPLLKEPLSFTRAVAVLGALAATTAVAQGTRYDSSLPEGGDRGIRGALIVLASATIYSLKEVFFKRVFPSVSVSLTPFTDSLLVVGIIGGCSVLLAAPMLLLLDYSGLEPFVMPPYAIMQSYGVVALLMAAYQACLLAAIALTTPTFVAMGSMLTVPVSMIYDYFVRGYVVPQLSQLGIGGILFFFGVLLFSNQVDSACYACGTAFPDCIGGSAKASNGQKPTSNKVSAAVPPLV